MGNSISLYNYTVSFQAGLLEEKTYASPKRIDDIVVRKTDAGKK
jgi:hypothetical protein